MTFRFPSRRSEAMRVFETAVSAGSMTRVPAKTALNPGSSQQGNARRASVASNSVAARVRLEPDLVTCWDDVTRKPVEIHGLVASWTVDGTIRTLPHAAGHVVTLLRSSRHRQGHRVPSRS